MKTTLQPKATRLGQRGFTLIELLISIVIGLIILSAVLGLFVSMIRSNTDSIKTIQLNHELRAAMSLISRDLRRAGANRNAAADATAATPSNPFSVAGTTRLAIASNQQGDANSCITYSYDSNEANELYGFRLDSAMGTVETRAGGAACNAGGWSNITDENLVNITALTFTDITVVENGINIRQITTALTGVLRSDATITRTIIETVKLRNDEF